VCLKWRRRISPGRLLKHHGRLRARWPRRSAKPQGRSLPSLSSSRCAPSRPGVPGPSSRYHRRRPRRSACSGRSRRRRSGTKQVRSAGRRRSRWHPGCPGPRSSGCLDLTRVGGHTRVSDVNANEGSAQDAGSDTKLLARVQTRSRPPRPLLAKHERCPDSQGAWRLGQLSGELGKAVRDRPREAEGTDGSPLPGLSTTQIEGCNTRPSRSANAWRELG
jgi:hypothetical protein